MPRGRVVTHLLVGFQRRGPTKGRNNFDKALAGMARDTAVHDMAHKYALRPAGGIEREAYRVLLLDAMAEVVAERGLRGASVVAVTRRASVSRAAFSELFVGVDDCFEALLNHTLTRATTLIDDAFALEPSWSASVLAGLEALLVFLDSEPVAARACLLETVRVSPEALESLSHMLERLRLLVDGGRGCLSLERQPPAATAEAVVASILGILRGRLLASDVPPFVDLLDRLAEVIVAPYLGPAAAARAALIGTRRAAALLRARPEQPAAASVGIPRMLCHASAHRTRACLRYLAENPGSSNWTVALGIGISHPGQASTLLARLHAIGLLVKTSGRPGRPNAWSLSPYGAEVARALYPRLTGN